jgi:2-keto-3-deoxy-L-fuconate dehydrogenase
MANLNDQHTLVTGRSRGIGGGIGDAFVAAGATVSACGRVPRPRDFPTRAHWYKTEIADSSDEDWAQLMGVNARGVFNCCRAFIPRMRKAGGGNIINIGSISGRTADPSMALYNASKAFVHGLTHSIAIDHGSDGIRCNAIAPGWVITELASAAFALANNRAAAERDALARHPSGRFGQSADITQTAVWLASDEASFATGQVFVIDGGLTSASPLQPGLY